MAQKSPLTGLPPELRNMIYAFALISIDCPIDVSSFKHPNEPALLATCTQIRAEALPIFYSENAFRFVRTTPLHSDLSMLYKPSQWLGTLGETRCALIKDFCIELGPEKEPDTPLTFFVNAESVLRFMEDRAEEGNVRCQKGVKMVKETAEKHIVGTRRLGMRLSAIHFAAPDKLVSVVHVFNKLFQEAGERALNKHRGMDQV